MGCYGMGGKPGSGKSFWVVHHMLTKYFNWDKTHGEWVRRFPVEICTNVDELKLDHFPLDEMIERSGVKGAGGTVESFFTVEYQRGLLKRFPRIIYIIDEAGRYFDKGFKVRDVLYFFQYHRHLGIDIYLISSALEEVCPAILRVMEYRLVAKERSKRLLNEFRYVKYLGGIKAGSTVLRGDSRIFNLYRSMQADETEKIPSVTRRYGIWVLVFICAGIVMFRYTVYSMTAPKVGDVSGVHRVENGDVKTVSGGKKGSGGSSGAASLGENSKSIVVEKGKEVSSDKGVVSREEPIIDLLRLKADYVQVHVSTSVDGSAVVYCDDGRHFPANEIPFILREAVRVGKELYIKRRVFEVASEGPADRMGARPIGVGANQRASTWEGGNGRGANGSLRFSQGYGDGGGGKVGGVGGK